MSDAEPVSSRPLAGITVLLDLDGTLTDSASGIIASMQYAVDALGLPPLPADARSRFVGPPMHDNLRALYAQAGLSATADQLERAVVAYREHYVPIGLFDNSLFAGVPGMLADLARAGATLAVATSKAEPLAIRILEHFGIGSQFATIVGSSPDGSRSAKADIIGEARRRLGGHDVTRTVMVGDRSHDVHGAQAHHIACYGAGWGYGVEGELAAAGAVEVLPDPTRLLAVLTARFSAIEAG